MNKKLKELIDEIHKMSGIGKITLTERIQALLTSEVEKERKRLLGEVLRVLPRPKEGKIGEDSHKASYRLGQTEYDFEARKAILGLLEQIKDLSIISSKKIL